MNSALDCLETARVQICNQFIAVKLMKWSEVGKIQKRKAREEQIGQEEYSSNDAREH